MLSGWTFKYTPNHLKILNQQLYLWPIIHHLIYNGFLLSINSYYLKSLFKHEFEDLDL